MQATVRVEVDSQFLGFQVLEPGQVLVLGRAQQADVELDDLRVSRRHASLELRPDGVYVTDHGSRNGTWLEAERLEPEQPHHIPVGATVRLGRHTIRVGTVLVDVDTTRALTQAVKAADLPSLVGFSVLEELGSGGTGRVWKARQLDPERLVAIKMLRQDMQLDEEDRERFQREAQLCRKVRSPFVVQIYEAQVIRNRAFLVLEYVEGPTASQLLEDGPLPLPGALRIGEQVGWALTAMERAGVVHRDIKPSNILIGPKGRARLTDFGIAKDLGASNLTESGMGLGSIPYVSPEQLLEAKGVDSSTDVYGLGATLYHLIAGQLPFPRGDSTVHEVARAIALDDPPALEGHRPDCPRGVATLIRRMLEKDRERRPTAREVAQVLAAQRVGV